MWEKLLYAHLIADWPRHNFHEKSKKSAGFLRIFLRIFVYFLPSPGTWNLQRPLEPEPGTWPLHRLGATVAEPEPGTSGTCWAGHRGTGTSEPWGEAKLHSTGINSATQADERQPTILLYGFLSGVEAAIVDEGFG